MPTSPHPPSLSVDLAAALLDAAPDGLLVVDPDGRVLLANRQADELFGFDRGELEGRSVDDLVPATLRSRHAGHRAGYQVDPRVRPMGASSQLSARRRSGDLLPVEISLSPLELDGRTVVIAAIRDVTERRAVEEALSDAREAVAVGDDRERIARDLHDTVIQRLFAAGMSLQGIVSRIPDADVRDRAEQVIDQLDETIREIRSTIFSLHVAEHRITGLRGELLELATELEVSLGFSPDLRFSGAVETMAPEVAEQLLPTLREALTNVARHAHATTVSVLVEVGADVVMQVTDDGVGTAEPRAAGYGLTNLRGRAECLGGTCAVETLPGKGTIVTWRVPSTPPSA